MNQRIEVLNWRDSLAQFVKPAWEILNPTRPLIWRWYHDAICEHMEAFAKRIISKLMIWTPPGTTKSTIVSVCYPAWRWANDPSLRILIGTNSDGLKDRDSLACRKLVLSDWYRAAFREDERGNITWDLSTDQNQKDHYSNTRTGFRQAVTTGETVTGKKGDELIIDDPHSASKVRSKAYRDRVIHWFREEFYNRVNDFVNCARAVIGQRTDLEDLQSELEEDGSWTILNLPERYTSVHIYKTPLFEDGRDEGEFLRPEEFGEKQELDAIKTMGPLAYAAQHLQRPEARQGRMFDRDKVRLVSAYPVGTYLVRYWDTAASIKETACYSAGVLIGRTPEGRTIFVDHMRGRWVPSDRNRIMRNSGLKDMELPGYRSYHFYFEKGSSDAGIERDAALISYLSGLPVKANPAKGDKIVRAEPLSDQWAAGNVDVVIGPWNKDFLDDMEGFPQGPKDTTDAASGGFNRLIFGVSDCDPATAPDEETELGRMPSYTFASKNGKHEEQEEL